MVIAARHSYLPAMYELAQMYLNGIGVLQSCQIAATFYKAVAERNPVILSEFNLAKRQYEAKNIESAIVHFFMLAEMGVEVAQSNLAYIYETVGRKNDSLLWYHRAAYQGNVYARIKVGDLYYYGEGGVEQNFLNAAKFYQAADLENHAQATFNLGLMHLLGIGLDKVSNYLRYLLILNTLKCFEL